MSEALILASRLPGEGTLPFEIEVVPIECVDEFAYWRGVADHWDSDRTLVNLEHDIEADDSHIRELLDCPHPLCSWAYRCHWISTHIEGGVIAAGSGTRTVDVPVSPEAYYLQGGEEWAQWSAIGLVKITPDARITALRREPWNMLELAVHDAVQGPWHMHWPEVPHHHW